MRRNPFILNERFALLPNSTPDSLTIRSGMGGHRDTGGRDSKVFPRDGGCAREREIGAAVRARDCCISVQSHTNVPSPICWSY